MMLFLARSALCIGAVAAAGAGVGEITTALDRMTRGPVEGAGRACLASAGCLRAGLGALADADFPLPTPGPRETAPAPRKPGRPAHALPDRHR